MLAKTALPSSRTRPDAQSLQLAVWEDDGGARALRTAVVVAVQVVKHSNAPRVALLSFSLAIAGCITDAPTASRAATLPIPASWSTASVDVTAPSVAAPGATASVPAPTPLASWWRRFDDPLLVSLIDEALAANTSIRGARAALAQSRALQQQAAAGLWPALDVSAAAQRSRSGDGASGNVFRAGFDASWEPDVFGRLRAGVAAAGADARASEASLGDVQISVAAEVAVDYVLLRGLQARIDVANASLASQQETLQLTEWRYQAGLLTSLEVEQARAATAQTRALVPALEASARQTEHAIAVLSWHAPDALHERLEPGPGSKLAEPDSRAELVLSFPAETLRQRPDVRSAEARVTAASARLRQAHAARYPNFHLTGSLGLNALTLTALTSGSDVIANALASVALPLLDGGAARAQVRAQQAALLQAAASYDAAVLAALTDVEDSLVAMRSDHARLVSLRLAATAAQNAAALANMRYRSGLIDFQVLLETQRSVLSASDGVASTTANLNADQVRLYKALGGGWEPTSAAPAVQVLP